MAHMEHLFTVDNLEYLARGGRISKASAFVGGLLNIKPLLDVEDGKLVPLEKIRGKKKLMKRILEIMHERGENLETQTIAISHGDDEETALEYKAAIQAEFGTKDIFINTVGAINRCPFRSRNNCYFFLKQNKMKRITSKKDKVLHTPFLIVNNNN